MNVFCIVCVRGWVGVCRWAGGYVPVEESRSLSLVSLMKVRRIRAGRPCAHVRIHTYNPAHLSSLPQINVYISSMNDDGDVIPDGSGRRRPLFELSLIHI